VTVPDLPLTGGEITNMQNVVASSLLGTAVIYRQQLTSDGIGGYTETFAAHGTVAARLGRLAPDQFGGQQLVVGGQIVEISSCVFSLPAFTDITETDRLEYAGVTYEVVDVLTRAPDELVRRVRARERVD